MTTIINTAVVFELVFVLFSETAADIPVPSELCSSDLSVSESISFISS